MSKTVSIYLPQNPKNTLARGILVLKERKGL